MPSGQSGEVIFDKNEKIWDGNLSLSPISGILTVDYDCGNLARGSNSLLRDKERKKTRWLGSQMRNFALGASTTKLSLRPKPTFNAFAHLSQSGGCVAVSPM